MMSFPNTIIQQENPEDAFNNRNMDAWKLYTLLSRQTKDGKSMLSLLAKDEDDQLAVYEDFKKVRSMLGLDAEGAAKQIQEKQKEKVEAELNKFGNIELDTNKEAGAPKEEPEAAEIDGFEIIEEGVPAVDYIRTIQNKYKGNTHPVDPDDYLKVLAARQLAYALKDRSARINEKDVNKLVGQMKENVNFCSRFRYSNRQKALRSALTSKYGEGLEDAAKKAVLEYPRGLSPRGEAITPYTPTVLERIDYLKGLAEKATDNTSIAAEILVTRNLIRSERDNKNGLKVKLTAEQREELNKRVAALEKDPFLQKMMKKPVKPVSPQKGEQDYQQKYAQYKQELAQYNIDNNQWKKNMDLLKGGHGGALIEELRKQARKQDGVSDIMKGELKANTLAEYRDDVKQQMGETAAALQKELARIGRLKERRNGDMDEVSRLIGQTKKLLTQYIAVGTELNKKGKGNLEKAEDLDVKWTEMNQKAAKAEQNEFYKTSTNNITPIGAQKLAEKIATSDMNVLLFNRQAPAKQAGAKEVKKDDLDVSQILPN